MKKDRQFLLALGGLALPIIIQNLLSSAIGTADTLMLGVVGQNHLAAVSLANQLFFVLNLFFAGLTSSAAIMLSQYLGRKDSVRAGRIFVIACVVSEAVCTLFALTAICLPHAVMRILTGDAILIEEGATYLRIVGMSYVFMGISQIYMVLLKARKETRRSMIIGVVTMLVNLALNAVFIFGLFGAPKMGTRGVAIATCIARGIELAICAADMIHRRPVTLSGGIERGLLGDFARICAPLTVQGFVWGGAMAAISAIMGHLGSDSVAAHSVAAVIQNIATVTSFGLADAGAILLGRELGAGEYERAKTYSKLLLKSAVLFGVIGCAAMLIAEPLVVRAVPLSARAQDYLVIMYRILSVNTIFASVTYTMLCGVFPSGGDTQYGLCLDGTVMWSLVALGSLAAFVLKLNPIAVFVILSVDELTKTPLVLLRYKKGIWIQNITREKEEAVS